MEIKRETELLHKDALKYLQVFGTIFAFILFVEINLFNLASQYSQNYKKPVGAPNLKYIVFLGGSSILILVFASSLSYYHLVFSSQVIGGIKLIAVLIYLSVSLFMISLVFFFGDVYNTMYAWSQIGIIS